MMKMMRYFASILFTGVFILLFVPVDGEAASIESLVMPGEVIEGHAKYENECNKCHKPFSKKGQDELCLDCHKDVALDVKNKKGFHTKIWTGKNIKCKSCHAEHKGRDAIIVHLDKDTFDRENTDFELKRSHKKVACASCHKKGKKYREVNNQCIDCHKQNDPHAGRLGKECDNCHREDTWRKYRFDHSKTDFALKGKHQDTDCKACHPNERYKDTPKDCFSCHKLNDEHYGRYGKKCESCHSTKEWTKSIFDHGKDTDFSLKGAHQKIKCTSCHKGTLYKEKTSKTCIQCHRYDDAHKGGFGNKCHTCHSENEWKKVKFDHGKETDFSLLGKHKDLKCNNCHRGNLYKQKLKTDCYMCHKQEDVHSGQEGKKCEKCHDVNGWRKQVQFEHDLTSFPLTGLHAIVPCEECHASLNYKDAEPGCNKCHEQKDVHKNSLGPNCENCHTPNGWGIWKFDHNSQTDFKLDGAHEGLSCSGCHVTTVNDKINVATECVGCHSIDDVHSGEFGPQCERCHNNRSFREIEMLR